MSDKLMRTVFDWEYFAIYLSGGIDFANDGGVNWRDQWTKGLISIGINPKQIYNPCRKPLSGTQFDLDNERELGKKFRQSEDWDGLMGLMSQILHVDLRLVDKSDIVLVNFPKIKDNHEAIQNWDTAIGSLKGLAPSLLVDSGQKLRDTLFNMRIPTYGTIHEIVVAHLQRKPIFVVWEDEGKSQCSSWIMKLVGHDHVFSSFDNLLEHLKCVSNGEKAFDANEWLLLNP